jgi:exopolyphosphatase/guanosine-5'-triphosphate,3'-diphosphate pyrophosphatase
MTSVDMWTRHHRDTMRVGVVDVGSNTVRLLVAGGGRPEHGRRAVLRLGDSVERFGSLPESTLAEAAATVAEFADDARAQGAESIEVLVTSPGRQAANGQDLLERVAAAARAPVRLVSAAEEGRLAFVGAISATKSGGRKLVAVCDVGGGSAQVAVGTRRDGPAWIRSIDLGATRLASRCLGEDPPGREALARAGAEVASALDGFAPPLPHEAYAVGGSARALRRVVGDRLGRTELAEAVELLAKLSAAKLVRDYDIDELRAPTLPAGAVILAALQERLGVPLKVLRSGGIRQGAAAELAARRMAAA